MPGLHELAAARLPEAILRSPFRARLFPGGSMPPAAQLQQLLEVTFALLGADTALTPLALPFSVVGHPDSALAAAALLREPPPPPPPEVVLAAARSWRPDGEADALDSLWCPPGETWLGMASQESRARASAMADRPLLGRYMMRSLEASLQGDLASVGGESLPCGEAWGQAIVLEDGEMAAAVPGWPHGLWGVVVLDDEGGRARTEACADDAELASALGGRAVWPPRPGMAWWLPQFEEEMRFVDALVALAAIRPPRPRAAWGSPDDEVEW